MAEAATAAVGGGTSTTSFCAPVRNLTGRGSVGSAVFCPGLLMGFFGLMLRPWPTCSRSSSVPTSSPNIRDTPVPRMAGAACGEWATGLVNTSLQAWPASTGRFSPAWAMSFPQGCKSCKPCASSRKRSLSTDASVAPFEVWAGWRSPPIVEPGLARMGAPLTSAGTRDAISGILIATNSNQE